LIPQARAILSGRTLGRVLEGQQSRALPPPDVAVVVDVLRATTTLVHAFAHGAAAARAFADPDEAHRAGTELPKGTFLLCGERGGLRLPGFDLGNSPREYVADFVRGRTLLFCTSNGSKAFARTREARRQLAAAFVNASAVVRRLQTLAAEADDPPTRPGGEPVARTTPFEVWIVAAGEADQACGEDTACVLALLEALGAADPPFATGVEPGDEAVVEAVSAAGATRLEDDALAGFLAGTPHGRALVEADFQFGRDIRDAARRDAFEVVPEGRGGTLDTAGRPVARPD
jgi:2-phosphosulfolactate phosphatase